MMKRLVVAFFLALAAAGCSCDEPSTGTLESAMAVSPDSIDFGKVTVGATSAPKTFRVSNPGSAPLLVEVESDEAVFEVSPKNASLAPGGSTEFSVTFSPTALKGVTGNIHVNSNAAKDGHAMVALSGEGIAAAVTVTPRDGIDFGDVARDRKDTNRDDRAAPARTLKVLNAGSDGFEVLSAEVVESADGAFLGDLSSLLGAYASAESREAEVRFDPAVLGQLEGAVKITTNSPTTPEIVVPLTGRGTAPVLRACVLLDATEDQPAQESCTPDLPAAGNQLGWQFGSFIDLEGRSGSLVIRNEGNLPLALTTLRYQPASPDIRFWLDDARTVEAEFDALQPVICPVGVEDARCTHEEAFELFVDYVARGSLCCHEELAAGEPGECLALVENDDCSLASNSDMGLLSIFTTDPIWKSLLLEARGNSWIAIARVGHFNGGMFQDQSARLTISNDGTAPLTVNGVFLSDPEETSCASGTPCPCSETPGSLTCLVFQVDPAATFPFDVRPGETADMRVFFHDANPVRHELDLLWVTTDPVEPVRRSHLVVDGQGPMPD